MDDQPLRDYFKFDETDLNANRSGRFSDKQQKKIIQEDKKITKLLIVIGIGLAAVTLMIVYFAIFPVLASWQTRPTGGNIGALFLPGLWGLIAGGLAYLVLHGAIKSRMNFSKVKFKKVEGPLHFVAVKSDDSEDIGYDLRLGKERLGLGLVNDDMRSAMQEGDIYAVYYYKFNDDKHLLSLEWLESAAPSKI